MTIGNQQYLTAAELHALYRAERGYPLTDADIAALCKVRDTINRILIDSQVPLRAQLRNEQRTTEAL